MDEYDLHTIMNITQVTQTSDVYIKHKKVCLIWYRNIEMRAEKEAQPSFLHRLQGVVKASEIPSLLFNKVPK